MLRVARELFTTAVDFTSCVSILEDYKFHVDDNTHKEIKQFVRQFRVLIRKGMINMSRDNDEVLRKVTHVFEEQVESKREAVKRAIESASLVFFGKKNHEATVGAVDMAKPSKLIVSNISQTNSQLKPTSSSAGVVDHGSVGFTTTAGIKVVPGAPNQLINSKKTESSSKNKAISTKDQLPNSLQNPPSGPPRFDIDGVFGHNGVLSHNHFAEQNEPWLQSISTSVKASKKTSLKGAVLSSKAASAIKPKQTEEISEKAEPLKTYAVQSTIPSRSIPHESVPAKIDLTDRSYMQVPSEIVEAVDSDYMSTPEGFMAMLPLNARTMIIGRMNGRIELFNLDNPQDNKLLAHTGCSDKIRMIKKDKRNRLWILSDSRLQIFGRGMRLLFERKVKHSLIEMHSYIQVMNTDKNRSIFMWWTSKSSFELISAHSLKVLIRIDWALPKGVNEMFEVFSFGKTYRHALLIGRFDLHDDYNVINLCERKVEYGFEIPFSRPNCGYTTIWSIPELDSVMCSGGLITEDLKMMIALYKVHEPTPDSKPQLKLTYQTFHKSGVDYPLGARGQYIAACKMFAVLCVSDIMIFDSKLRLLQILPDASRSQVFSETFTTGRDGLDGLFVGISGQVLYVRFKIKI